MCLHRKSFEEGAQAKAPSELCHGNFLVLFLIHRDILSVTARSANLLVSSHLHHVFFPYC